MTSQSIVQSTPRSNILTCSLDLVSFKLGNSRQTTARRFKAAWLGLTTFYSIELWRF